MHDQSTNRRAPLAEDAALRRDLERIQADQADGDTPDRDTRQQVQQEITDLRAQLAGVMAERDEARTERDAWQQVATDARTREDEAVTAATHLRLDLVLMTAERDAHRDAYQDAIADRDGEIAALAQACEIAEREWQKERGVNAMHARQLTRLEATLAGRTGVGRGDHRDDGDDSPPPIGVDPRLLAFLLEQAAQTETLRRKYQRQSLLLTDKRIKPAEKVLTAAVWDLAAPVGRDPGPAAPRKIYRAALADRTGMSAGTISRKLSDLDTMGLISLDHRQTAEDYTELWVGVGQLPDKALTAEEVDALARNRQKDRARPRRCPDCGGAHLRATAYACLDCGRACTEAEAVTAGATLIVTDSGSIVDTTTGEVIVSAPTRADSARGQSPAHSSVPDVPDVREHPPADSAHPRRTVPRCADSARPPSPRIPPLLTPRDSGARGAPLPLSLSVPGDPPCADSAHPPHA